jgi:hypothetical protein
VINKLQAVLLGLCGEQNRYDFDRRVRELNSGRRQLQNNEMHDKELRMRGGGEEKQGYNPSSHTCCEVSSKLDEAICVFSYKKPACTCSANQMGGNNQEIQNCMAGTVS